MNETVITWNAPNIITGIVWVFLTLVIVGFIIRALTKTKEASQ
jgi:hypothetical protein